MNAISRRSFIGQASCAGIGGTSLFSTLLSLRLANSLAAQASPSDYKALVCLFLAGGNDSFNMLVPTTSAEYAAYSNVRSNLSLARDTLLQITPANTNGRTFGIHSAMPEIRDLFTQGRLSFVSNVGSLIRPMTLADYNAERYRPLSLYSHADQIKQWQTCIPDKRTAIGWGGRAADIIKSTNAPSMVSMNISLSGQNTFLTGESSFSYSIGSFGAIGPNNYDPLARNTFNAFNTAAVDSLLDADYRRIFEKAFGEQTRDAIDTYYEFATAVSGAQLREIVPESNFLARNLAMVAKTASVAGKLGAKRQIFFVQFGGWDHHDEVLNNQSRMLRTVSEAVGFFWSALGELGLRDNVTLFTASDFGRTLRSNGNGTDHGWGGNHFALGGAVVGGRIAGNRDQLFYPDLTQLHTFDTGQGRIVPGVSVDEYARELLFWFGVSASEMDYVLPAFNSRFGGRPSLELMTTSNALNSAYAQATSPIVPPASTAPNQVVAAGPSAGGGGGSATLLGTAALGGALLLKNIIKRRQKFSNFNNST